MGVEHQNPLLGVTVEGRALVSNLAAAFGKLDPATKNTRILAKAASGLPSTNPLIQVRSVASLTATRVGTRTFTFSGRVYPALSGRLVSLYRTGTLVGQARCASTGIYSMTRTLGAGTVTFQTKTASDTYNLGTTSPVRSVRIY